MESSGSKRRRPEPSRRPTAGIYSMNADALSSIFSFLDPLDLVRCSAVCTTWNHVIQKSTLMIDRLFKKYSIKVGTSDKGIPSKRLINMHLEEIAMNEHASALTSGPSGSAEIYQWTGHSAGVRGCHLKRGLIATGVGDKVVRLWSADTYKCLGGYSVPDTKRVVDFDFDESKIVALMENRLCIWRRNGRRSLLQPCGGTFARSLCMRYIDPEAVVGCEDGKARIFDMYSGSCSRIIRVQGGPITCLALDDQLILSGSSFGKITLLDHSSGQLVGSMKSSFSPLGIVSLCLSPKSHLVFAGSTAGYTHCWDLRTLRPLWETRISSNVTYSINHLSSDASTLAVGGIDGVLRIIDQESGEVISSYICREDNTASSSNDSSVVVQKRAQVLRQGTLIDSIPKKLRPSITCLAVGLKKIVTTHDDKYIRVWKFHK